MKTEHVIAGMLLLFFLISGIFYAWTNSVTSDEPTYITTGYMNLRFNDYFFNIEHAPFAKQLAALPLLFIELNFPMDIYRASTSRSELVDIYNAFLFRAGNNLDIMLFLSRIPNVLISLLLGVFIYLYSKKLNGSAAGIISLALFSFSPMFLGNSPLATLDSTVSTFYFITIYFFMKFTQTGRNLFLALTGVSLGLAFISKHSALLLIPIFYILAAIYTVKYFKDAEYNKIKNFIFLLPLLPFASSYKSSFKFIAPVLFIFLFFSVFYRDNKYSRKIKFLCAILLVILTIAFTVVILDYTDYKWFPFSSATKAYFKGFSCFQCRATGGDLTYILGKNLRNGRWYYFPLAMIFKEPFAFLIILLLGLAALFSKKENMMSKSLLLLPSIGYVLVAMFVNKVNIGIRLLMPVYPFLYVIGGYSVLLARRSRIMMGALTLLLLVLAADVLSAYPSHLSYFNRLIGGTGKGHKFLSDSNLAWGQDWKRMKEYIDKNGIKKVKLLAAFTYHDNCKYYKIPFERMSEEERIRPEEGYYVIEATELASGNVKWADKIKPISRVGGSLLVYDIGPDDMDKGIR